MDQNGPFWPKEVHFGPFRSANGTLATPHTHTLTRDSNCCEANSLRMCFSQLRLEFAPSASWRKTGTFQEIWRKNCIF